MSQQHDPWNQQDNKPKNIDDWVDQGVKKFYSLLQTGKNSNNTGNNSNKGGQLPPFFKFNKKVPFIILLVLGAIVFYNSVFQVQPGETGVVLRFGKHHRNAPPGLNFLIPFMESLTKVNIETVRSLEFVNREGFSGSTYDNVASMVTADRNVININWVVQYRIKNPENFLFNIQNVVNSIKDFSEYTVRRNVGNRDFDYILNRREELAFVSSQEIQDLLDRYQSGVELVALQLLDVTPPEKVRPAFNEVNEADQDKTRLVNEAQREVNQRIPKARGDAKKLILESEGYSVKRINEALGNASRFDEVYSQYRNYKEVTRTQLYVDTLKQVLPTVEEIIVVDKTGNLLPLLNINKNQ